MKGISLENTQIKVAIYGGNGFVGTHLAKRLSAENVSITCLSRTGHKPPYLNDEAWSKSVIWSKGDAGRPDLTLLEKIDVVIILVGSAPLPTFSNTAFEQQVHNNGIAPSNAINGALIAGVKRIILVGAKLPSLLNTDRFGYAKGKNLALDAAKKFANQSPEHSAVVLQPGAIYGKRRLKGGAVIPLDIAMSPLAKLVPSQLTSVHRVAERITMTTINSELYNTNFTVLTSLEI